MTCTHVEVQSGACIQQRRLRRCYTRWDLNPGQMESAARALRKATMLQHQTHDPYYVRDFLGHKSLKNTEIYINIEHTLFEDSSDEFTVKVAERAEEIKALLEVGFEYVCEKDGLAYLRKRK